jgi:hypothetical protein
MHLLEEFEKKTLIQNVEEIDFKVICAPMNSNKSQKTIFWKEK